MTIQQCKSTSQTTRDITMCYVQQFLVMETAKYTMHAVFIYDVHESTSCIFQMSMHIIPVIQYTHTFEKLATISCTSDLIGAMYITLNSSRLTDPSGAKCLLISLRIQRRATLVLPAPWEERGRERGGRRRKERGEDRKRGREEKKRSKRATMHKTCTCTRS